MRNPLHTSEFDAANIFFGTAFALTPDVTEPEELQAFDFRSQR
jgi:hypothetical protein